MKDMNCPLRSKYHCLAGFLSALSFLVFAVAPAQATNCPPENVRWANSSNRIYVSGSVECTLTEIKQSISVYAPLELVSTEPKIWFLGASLIIQDGARVLLHGSAVDGDVDELRLKSNNLSDPNSFVFIRAQWGEVEIKNTRVTSWDEASNAPDEEYEVFGRAFIHVRSYLEDDGVTARESRMDIVGSDVGYLGYYAAESHGLVWKVYGTQVDLYDKVNVYGDILDSTIHHNYMGMYSYGAYAMNIVNNEFYENVQYGIDPYDNSDWLVIEGNYSHHNGNHGIICSRYCDNLIIRNNRSSYNNDHGIMLH